MATAVAAPNASQGADGKGSGPASGASQAASQNLPLSPADLGLGDEPASREREPKSLRNEAGAGAEGAADQSIDSTIPEGAVAEPGSEAAAEEFQFAGETFKSREHAEQSLRTLRGMHKANQAKLSEAVQRANEWHAHANRLAAQATQSKGNQPVAQSPAAKTPGAAAQPQGVESAKGTEAQRLVESLDWPLINDLAAENGITFALYEGIDQAVEKLRAEFDARLEEKLKPYSEEKAQQAQLQKTVNLFVSASGFVDRAGNVAYPELRSPDSAEAVASFWKNLELPPEIAFSNKGIHYAVLAYREWKATQDAAGDPSAQPTDGEGTATPEAQAAVDSVKAAAAATQANGRAVISGSSRSPVTGTRAAGSPADQIRQAIRGAGSKQHSLLGVSP